MGSVSFNAQSYSQRLQDIEAALNDTSKKVRVNDRLVIVKKENGFVWLLKIIALPFARMFGGHTFRHFKLDRVVSVLISQYSKHENQLINEDRTRLSNIITRLDDKTSHRYGACTLIALTILDRPKGLQGFAPRPNVEKREEAPVTQPENQQIPPPATAAGAPPPPPVSTEGAPPPTAPGPFVPPPPFRVTAGKTKVDEKVEGQHPQNDPASKPFGEKSESSMQDELANRFKIGGGLKKTAGKVETKKEKPAAGKQGANMNDELAKRVKNGGGLKKTGKIPQKKPVGNKANQTAFGQEMLKKTGLKAK